MQDITESLLAARRRGGWPVVDVLASVGRLESFADLRTEWDPEADEQWVRVFHTATLVALLWEPGPLAIVVHGYHDLAVELGRVAGVDLEVVEVSRSTAPVLCVDPKRVAEVWPDRGWPADAVDASAFSAVDLWYATS